MSGRFENPVIFPNGDLKVEGPFVTDGEVLGDVLVRFLIIPDESRTAIFGMATIAKDDLRVFRPDPPDPANPGAAITTGEFSATVPSSGLKGGIKVRGVGISVAVKRADPPDPPAIETFTWCVDLVVALP